MSTPAPPSEIVRRPWQTGLGPYYIGLFLWVVFYDQVGRRALPVGGLMWSILGAAVAGPLAYLLLFRVPASWGQATGKTLPELAAGTFGEGGARWVPGLLIGLAEVAWFGVATTFAVDFTLRGLAEAGFVREAAFRAVSLGGLRLKPLIFLTTTFAWGLVAALIGRKFVKLVAAIMYVFPVFPAMLLGGAMFAMLGGLRTFAPSGIDPAGLSIPASRAGLWAMMHVVQLVLGFAAMAGVLGADWGAASTSERDVRVGGWVAFAFAPVVIATIALVAIAGFQGRANPADVPALDGPLNPLDARVAKPAGRSISAIRTLGEPPPATFRALMTDGVGGRGGAGMLIVFGAIALAPGVFAANVLGIRLHESLPALSRFKWTLLAMAVAWPMMAVGLFDRTEPIFAIMGALFAPVAACLAADSVRHKGAWSGPRWGLNPPGVAGWATGAIVGLLPLAGGRLRTLEPATFWAFVAAFAAYWGAALVVGEAAPVVAEKADQGDGAVAARTRETAPITSSSTDLPQGDGSP